VRVDSSKRGGCDLFLPLPSVRQMKERRRLVAVGLYRVAGHLPSPQSAQQSVHVFRIHPSIDRVQRRTGAGLFGWSDSIKDERFVGRQFTIARLHVGLGK
jgi:hypothetical protein